MTPGETEGGAGAEVEADSTSAETGEAANADAETTEAAEQGAEGEAQEGAEESAANENTEEEGAANNNAEEPPPEERPEEKRRRLGGFHRKIERLERQNQILLEQLQRTSGAPQGQPGGQGAAEKTPAEKAQDYIDAMVEQKLAAREAQRAAEVRQAEFQKRVAEAATARPDFEDVVAAASDVPVSRAVHEAILTSKAPGEIMYALAKNPAELARISALPPLDAARAVWELEAKASGTTPPKPKAAVRPPAPPSKVAGNSSSTRSLEDLPLSEYKRALRSGRR